MKKEVSRKRKTIQGLRGSKNQRIDSEAETISTLKKEYKKFLCQYRAIRRTKYENWKKFITECGNEKL